MIMREPGFTLIELLIVVAIIAILAAIAIPNFLAAQTRSKVARVKSDIRTIIIGLECYRVDNDNYPWHIPLNLDAEGPELRRITTPITYLTSVSIDLFRDGTQWDNVKKPDWYDYTRFIQYNGLSGEIITKFWPPFGSTFRNDPPSYGFMTFSLGPDRKEEHAYIFEESFTFLEHTYDPSNGTISSGDIYGTGGLPNVQ